MSMNKKTTTIIAVALTALAAATLYYVFRVAKTSKKTPLPDGTGGKEPTVVYDKSDFPLEQGSKGNKVKELQTLLGFATKDIDGDFGPKTAAALKSAYGKASIVDQGEFDAFKAKMEASRKTAGAKARGRELLDIYESNPNSRLLVLADNIATKVNLKPGKTEVFETLPQRWTYTYSGKPFSRKDLEFYTYTTGGRMIIKDKDGYMSVDPNAWTIAT